MVSGEKNGPGGGRKTPISPFASPSCPCCCSGEGEGEVRHVGAAITHMLRIDARKEECLIARDPPFRSDLEW